MIRNSFFSALIFFICSCSAEVSIDDIHVSDKPVKEQQETLPASDEKATKTPTKVSSKYRTVTLFEPGTGWGYDIFEGDKLLIHQPHIPVVQGVKGFKTESDAQKVADAVVEKLTQGIMPPSLSWEEMMKLGVI